MGAQRGEREQVAPARQVPRALLGLPFMFVYMLAGAIQKVTAAASAEAPSSWPR